MFLDNKYTKWYYMIIENALTRINVNEYTEQHHIIPKSIGGSNESNNLITLTAREHFMCHKLLTKMLIGKNKAKMIYAFWFMHINGTHTYTSISYEKTKILHSKEMSQLMKKLSNTKEGKRIRSENGKKNKGRKHSAESNAKRARPGKFNGMYGKTHTDDVKTAQGKRITEQFGGKTYEEIYGDKRAEQIKERRSIELKDYIANNPGCRDGANNGHAKKWRLTTPDGVEYIVVGLKKWCRDNNISYGALINLHHNNITTTKGSVAGWTITQISHESL